jgi:hypothetical protein
MKIDKLIDNYIQTSFDPRISKKEKETYVRNRRLVCRRCEHRFGDHAYCYSKVVNKPEIACAAEKECICIFYSNSKNLADKNDFYDPEDFEQIVQNARESVKEKKL